MTITSLDNHSAATESRDIVGDIRTLISAILTTINGSREARKATCPRM